MATAKRKKPVPLVVKEWLGYTHAVDGDNTSLVRVGSTNPNDLGVRVLRAMVEAANNHFLKAKPWPRRNVKPSSSL